MVGAILGKSDFVRCCNWMDVTQNRSQHQIKNSDVLLTYIGILTMGRTAYDDVHEFDDAAENIGLLVESGCYFIIKRNLRKESRES